MAKLSVYVPDELLAEAKQADPDVRLSAMLQDALRSRLFDRNARPYAQPSDDQAREREAAQRMVIDRVAAAWRSGYAVGIEFAKSLPWEAFERFAALNWNLSAWRRSFDDEEYPHVTATDEERKEGLTVLDFGPTFEEATFATGTVLTNEEGTPVGVPAEGFTDAIRDVWEGARALRPARAETTATAEDVLAGVDDDHPA